MSRSLDRLVPRGDDGGYFPPQPRPPGRGVRPLLIPAAVGLAALAFVVYVFVTRW